MDAKPIQVTIDMHSVKSFLTGLELKQVPFATAKALTQTAQEAQGAVKSGLGRKFILKNKWTEKGIQFQRADKKDWPDCFAIIGSRDEYMVKQEEGGQLPPKRKRHAIPITARPSKTSLVPRKMRMENLAINFKLPQGGRPLGAKNGSRRNPMPFVAIPKSKKMGVYLRTGEYVEYKGRRIEKYRLLYRLQDKPTKYSKREWLEKIVVDIAQARMQPNFERALLEAIANAK